MEARGAMLLHSVGALAENAAVNFRFHLAGFSSLVTATSKDTREYRRGYVAPMIIRTRITAFEQITDTCGVHLK
jgi:hypothetical protein